MSNNLVIVNQSELYQIISKAVLEAFTSQEKQPQQKPKSEYLNLNQACEYLHIAPQTMYGLTSKRKIKFIKVLKNLLFTQADLDEFLNQGKKETKKELLNQLKFNKNGL